MYMYVYVYIYTLCIYTHIHTYTYIHARVSVQGSQPLPVRYDSWGDMGLTYGIVGQGGPASLRQLGGQGSSYAYPLPGQARVGGRG